MLPFLKSAALVALSAMFGRGVVIIGGIILANILGPEQFALFAFAGVTATSLSNIAMLGLLNGIPRFVVASTAGEDVDSILRVAAAIAVALAGLTVCSLLLVVVPNHWVGAPVEGYSVDIAVLTFAIGVNSLLGAVANGLELYRSLVGASFAFAALLLMLVSAFAIGLSQQLVVWVYVLASGVSSGLLLQQIFRRIGWPQIVSVHSVSRGNVKDVLSAAMPMLASSVLLNSGIWLAGRSLLGGAKGADEFAALSAGLHWFALASMASIVVSKVAVPSLTRSALLGLHKERSNVLALGAIVSIVSAGIVWLLVILLNTRIQDVYGSNFPDLGVVLVIITGAGVISAPISMINSELVAREMYGLNLVVILVWWICLVGLSFGLGDGASINVAISIVVSYFVYLVVSIGVIRYVRR